MGNWEFDKKAMDETLPEVKQWLAPFTSTEGSVFDDQNYNTDLVIPGRTVSLRGRWVVSKRTGENQFNSYNHEFTIRTYRPATGHPTEYAKILAGHGDWFFYYWVDNDTMSLVCATLIDLSVLRPHLAGLPCDPHKNQDPGGRGVDSEFNAYRIEHAANRKAVIAHVCDGLPRVTYRRHQLRRLSLHPDKWQARL